MCFADENRVLEVYMIFFNIFGEKGGKILGFLGLKTLMLISFFYIIKVTFDNKKITTKRHRVVHYLKKKKKKEEEKLALCFKNTSHLHCKLAAHRHLFRHFHIYMYYFMIFK
jgi:hypothetical protein